MTDYERLSEALAGVLDHAWTILVTAEQGGQLQPLDGGPPRRATRKYAFDYVLDFLTWAGDASDDELITWNDEAEAHDRAIEHSARFRKVSTRYARRVSEAYEGDIESAAAATDEQVAAKVAAWERAQGMEPVDWPAIGQEEQGR